MPIRYPLRITVAGLALGVAFDRLIVNHAVGASFPVFVVLVLLALGLALFWERLAPMAANLWIFAPLLFFAVMVAVRANGFITFLNVIAVLLLLCVIAVFLLREPLSRVSLPGYALSPLLAPLMAVLRGGQTARLAAISGAGAVRQQQRSSWAPVVRGVLLASPIVVIFALLLSSADLMFAEVLRRILPVDFVTFVQRLMVHGTIALTVGFILLGGLAFTLWRDEHSQEANTPNVSFAVSPFLGLTESAVILNAVNVLFAAFVVIQIPYLFGGQLNIDLGRTTYAEYARRGFGELVAVSVLVLGMLLMLGTLTKREGTRQQGVFNLSSTVMVGLTVVMLVSAFKRLLLYEMAYGFTEARIYPHVFMIWLALLLAWFLVTLWLKPGRFAIGLVAACIGFVATLNVMNVDDFIVRQNIRRYEEMGSTAFRYSEAYGRAAEQIDAGYLTQLSDDAIPALVQGVARLGHTPRQLVEVRLKSRLAELQQDVGSRSWPSFHFAGWRAYQALQQWDPTRSQ